MNITYLIPGSGGTFYCGNCHRDMLYMKSVRKTPGFDVTAIPLYLLPDKVNSGDGFEPGVFFGAVSMYLREKVPFFQRMPAFMDKFLDSEPMLKIAARQAGTTRTAGFEETTLNMIRGDHSTRQLEVERLAGYMLKNGKPDVIHISNALIIGLAKQLKDVLGIPIVCSLQNEDDWIDDMIEPYQTMAWKMIGAESVNVDAFISPSAYFKNMFIEKTGISGENIYVVPSGIDIENIGGERKNRSIPAIGYYSRINYHNGFDKLVDAFLKLKSNNELKDFEFHICGGYTSDDKPFVKEQLMKFKEHGLKDKVKVYTEFHGKAKEEFFNNIDIMSVPVRKYEAYGLFILEANAAGVPVVQPATGAFPEIVEMTGGGIVYKPDTVEALADSILKLSSNKLLRSELGARGRKGIEDILSLENMAIGIIEVYNKVLGKSAK